MQNKAALKETEDADVVINIDMKGFSPIDFSRSKELLNKGLIAGLSHMGEIKSLKEQFSSSG